MDEPNWDKIGEGYNSDEEVTEAKIGDDDEFDGRSCSPRK